jgi:hypothetical protein
MFYVLVVNGMHFHVVLVGASSTVPEIDFFRSEERLMVYYSNVCGLRVVVYKYMIKRLGLTGNGKLWMDGWMVLLRRRLLGRKVQERILQTDLNLVISEV